ncbi:MAG: KH domain-containing protein [Candidatus Pacebacteria bacterium]|nr:KH domain-containing protein [Candidatus Paceibacterota bacterium]PIR60338.1 MAG: RNA-binding protein [Candidatus Pacebacteria bacterium CG10_big_fil_rev_8_21_14_0_10_44_54]
MKNLLEFILIHLVEHPEEVSITEREMGDTTQYVIHVHPEDMGRVIGKGGSVIQSIRNISRIRAVKEGIRAHVVVADPAETETQQA